MSTRSAGEPRVRVLAVLLVIGLALVYGTSGSVGAQGSVRGFDGSTIKVAGYGIKAQLPSLGESAAARFKRFNDTDEIKGVKIETEGFEDDGSGTPRRRCRSPAVW